MVKNILRAIGLALLAGLALASCTKDDATQDNRQPQPQTDIIYQTLVGTEWEGSYADVIQSSHGQYNAILHWTVDFLADGQGELILWLECQATDSDADTYSITYTYNGDNTGTLDINDGQPFVIDPYNRTLTATLTFKAEFESGVTSTLGGETVLHQMR